MSLNVIDDSTIQCATYHFLLVACSNHVFILYSFWDIQRPTIACPMEVWISSHFKVTENGTIR